MSKAAQAQAGRDRARESRLKAARERRLQLDPEQLAREQRIDEAIVDIELAWETRADAERAVEAAEVAAAAAVARLLDERLSITDVVRLIGLDQPTVRRLRHRRPARAPARRGRGPPMSTRYAATRIPAYTGPLTECDFPGCHRPAHAESPMCAHHLLVRISARGSWIDDRHADGGHG